MMEESTQTISLQTMENQKHPTYGNGKICYIEIPADNIDLSAKFYQLVFGWQTRISNDGFTSFDDGVGEVSGTWVTGRKAASEAGLVISIMVSDIYQTIELISANGGKVIRKFNPESSEKVAWVTDPFGNILGLYQH